MKDSNASKSSLFFVSVLAILLIGGSVAGGYALCKAFSSQGEGWGSPTNVLNGDIAHLQYVACKKIPYDKRNKFHWDIIIPYEEQYWDIYKRRNDSSLHPSFIEDMKSRESYIGMFPTEEYPSGEELNNMPWENTFQPGQFSGVNPNSN